MFYEFCDVKKIIQNIYELYLITHYKNKNIPHEKIST